MVKGGKSASLIFVTIMRILYKFLPGIVWFFITVVLFTLPGSAIPKFDLFHKLQGDKLVHAFLFFVLCVLFMIPFKTINTSKKVLWFSFCTITLLFCIYGIGIEFVQKNYIANRSFDIGDIIADVTGCVTALWLGIKKWIKD